MEFSVEDTGIGIKDSEKHKIFTEFGKGEDVENNNPGGSGLGLSIVKRIVEKMNGQI